MGFARTAAAALGLLRTSVPAEDSTGTAPEKIIPRRSSGAITVNDAATLPATYRALQVLATSCAQLAIDVERAGVRIAAPSLIARPNLDMTRSEWIEAFVLCLGAHGEAFVRGDSGPTLAGARIMTNLELLPPYECHVTRDDQQRRWIHWRGEKYSTAEVLHVPLMRLPGSLRGLGPIQAARSSLTGVADMRDYMARWFRETGQPAGVLTSDQPLTGEDAKKARDVWNGLDAEGNVIDTRANPSGVRVLGKGLAYAPLLLNPKDAMFLEAQNFSTLEIARLFGIPSSLMLVGVQGASRTYANVEQEWTAFVRFTLLSYLRKIEDALSYWLPRGQIVRFRLDSLLRADTLTRYQAHALALDPVSGWMSRHEVRDIEALGPETQPAPVPQEDATA